MQKWSRQTQETIRKPKLFAKIGHFTENFEIKTLDFVKNQVFFVNFFQFCGLSRPALTPFPTLYPISTFFMPNFLRLIEF